MKTLLAVDYFCDVARRYPQHIAARHGSESVTYRELDEQSNRIAMALTERCGREAPVIGVLMERGIDLLAAMLAIFKIRGTYMPLDRQYPAERLDYMLEKSKCCLLLTARNCYEQAAYLQATKPELVLLDIEEAQESRAAFVGLRGKGSDLAYVIFTSGTTGHPKGVMIEQRSFINHLHAKVRDLEISRTDQVAQTASHCFDISLWQFMAALQVGACTQIIDRDVVCDPSRLLLELRECQVSVIQFVPSLLRSFVAEVELIDARALPALRRISTVGEALPPDVCRRWLAMYPSIPILNHYGPTECADGVTHALISNSPAEGQAFMPIGKPIDNLQIYVVRPDAAALTFVASGDVGELCVAGVGLARGYINDDARTEQAFVANPFSDKRGYDRLYKTGDLVRLREDGLLECLGRADRQVKLRGYRIELNEVEGLLGLHAAVEAAAVVVHYPADNRVKLTARETLTSLGEAERLPRLVAFVKLREEVTRSALREHMSRQLPDYMLPDLFFEMATLPLNANGKLDYKQLPSPESLRPLSDVKYLEPTDGVQVRLCRLLAEILHLDRLGRNDNFLLMGGDSLRAMLAINRIRSEFACEVSVVDLYHCSIDELTELLAEKEGGNESLPAIVASRRGEGGEAPASHIQKHLWFLWKLDPTASNYTLQAALECCGELDRDRFSRAWDAVVQYFDTLRIRFVEKSGNPYLTFDSPPKGSLRFIDLCGDQPAPRLAELKASEFQPSFDLAAGALYRALLVRERSDRHVVIFTTHEIIMDAWSLSVMVRKLREFYKAGVSSEDGIKAEISFEDFAKWESEQFRSDCWARQRSYWAQQLSGELPVLTLPSDKPRPRRMRYTGKSYAIQIPALAASRLRELAADNRTTLFSVLLTTFYALLREYSGQDDIIVGTPNVVRKQSGTEKLLGFFLNMLPLRAKMDPDKSFIEHLATTQQTVIGADFNAAYPFSRMLETVDVVRGSNFSPVFQAMFNMYSEKAELISEGQDDVSIVARELENGYTKYDLTLYCQEEGDGIYLQMSYCTELFSDELVSRMLLNLQQIIQVIIAAPAAPLAELDLRHPAEKDFLKRYNGGRLAYTGASTLREMFEARAKMSPVDTAYFWERGRISYAELDGAANRFANRLAAAGVGAGDRVLLGIDRGINALIVILAAIKLHATYSVIGANYPISRILEIAKDVAPNAFVATPLQREAFRDRGLVLLPSEEVAHGNEETDAAPSPSCSHEVLQVVYTSGSTGKPKGVVVPATACINRLHWMWGQFPFQAGDVCVVQKSAALVASQWEIFGPLLQGVPSLLLSQQELQDPFLLLLQLDRYRVTHLLCSPPLITGILTAQLTDGRSVSDLRLVTSSAEVLPPELARRFLEAFPQARLFNFYGSSECSSNAAWGEVCEVGADERTVPIGKPVANVGIAVVDDKLRPVVQGAVGEILVTGDCLASGYHDSRELTAERFVASSVPELQPFGTVAYRTGDLGRHRDDGRLEFLGRRDNQIKIHGLRVELDEISHVLGKCPGVEEAAVHLHRAADGEPLLTAYVVGTEAKLPSTDDGFRQMLRHSLLPHSIPRSFVRLRALPKLPGGKLDRSRLPLPRQTAAGVFAPLVTTTEHALAAVWQEVLGMSMIGADAHFFSLGGTSMLSVRCVAQAAKMDIRFSVSELYDYPVLRELAGLIDARSGELVHHDGDIDGGVEVTPTIRFMNRRMGLDEHFNMCAIWQDDSCRLDPAILESAIVRLAKDYPLVRTRISRDDDDLRFHTGVGALHLERVALGSYSELGDCTREVSGIAEKAQYAFRFDGRTWMSRFQLIEAEVGGRPYSWIFIIIHHFLVDGYGFRLLLEEVERYYLAIEHGQAPVPAFSGRAQLNRWVKALREHVSGSLDSNVAYWRSRPWELLREDGATVLEVEPVDSGADASRRLFEMLHTGQMHSDAAFETLCARKGIRYLDLDAESTKILLDLHPDRHGFDAFDVILCALAEVAGKGNQRRGLFLDNMDMLRTPILPGQDLSTVMGFTAELVPLAIVCEGRLSVAERLKAVRRQRNSARIHGIGLRAAAYLLPDDQAKALVDFDWPRVVVNYRAVLDNLRTRMLLGLAQPTIWTGDGMGPNRHHTLRLYIDNVDGKLRIQMHCALHCFSAEEANMLGRQLLHCLAAYAGCLRDNQEDVDAARLKDGATV
ncbi:MULTISPECIES: non-ribosomal peptide synthetase [unclassified Paraburkholderia]|uniref:non-ribosomal peptide synthetase n=1 Tax=unclassified Paraburkholderia TaxID=2615204 RepID=UPI0020B68EB2|nr:MULTISPECIES: non-ribosomal peptide synthetase [unclassified Paraburkholderia]MCP3720845.1 amino acid adenylation domain-containing protein [Paraburkholderia sp. CNPSo 3281]MCX5545582.1 amino acid adenylation domain-containing protein [Paraburkholderia sp. CNPSo 3076]